MSDWKNSPPPKKVIQKDDEFEVVVNDKEAMEEIKSKVTMAEKIHDWISFKNVFNTIAEEIFFECKGKIVYNEEHPEEDYTYIPQNYENVKKFVETFNKRERYIIVKATSKQEAAGEIHRLLRSRGDPANHHLKKSPGHPDPSELYRFILTVRIHDYQEGYKLKFCIISKKYNGKTQNWDIIG